MMELDEQELERILEWARKRVALLERRRQMAPLMEAMAKDIEQMVTQFAPSLMAGPSALERESVVKLERSLAEYPEHAREAQAKRDDALAAARKRTAALTQWLEKLP